MTHIEEERKKYKYINCPSLIIEHKNKQQTILGGNCKHRLKESCLTFWQDDKWVKLNWRILGCPPVDNGWPCYHCAGVRLGLLWVRNEVKRSCNACRAFEMPPTGEAHRIAARVFFTYQHHDEWECGGSQSYNSCTTADGGLMNLVFSRFCFHSPPISRFLLNLFVEFLILNYFIELWQYVCY